MPTGGISIEDAGEWLRAGAELVRMGSALLDGLTLRRDDYSQITRNARRLRERLDAVQEETVE